MLLLAHLFHFHLLKVHSLQVQKGSWDQSMAQQGLLVSLGAQFHIAHASCCFCKKRNHFYLPGLQTYTLFHYLPQLTRRSSRRGEWMSFFLSLLSNLSLYFLSPTSHFISVTWQNKCLLFHVASSGNETAWFPSLDVRKKVSSSTGRAREKRAGSHDFKFYFQQ